MAPVVAMVFNFSAFSVAVPTLRDQFAIGADMAAWLVIAYILPFMMLMPLYGRLGDGLGKRNLILLGLSVLLVGTMMAISARSMGWLLAARMIQGAGASGVVPLSIAIISERFVPAARGRALGAWNSVGPLTGVAAPLLAGLIIDHWGWRMIFAPVLLLGVVAIAVVYWGAPSLRRPQFGFLRHFDWLGLLLFAGIVVGLVTFVSSQPITGVAPLRDWRLLLVGALALTGFILRERQFRSPFLNLDLFRNSSLIIAAIGVGLRMFTMSGIGFLMPLYLLDVHSQSASAIGGMLMLNAGALFATMRLGGQLGDRWGSRAPVMAGMSIQAACMVWFALLPADAFLLLVGGGLVVHGLGAGLSLAPLHRAAMSHVNAHETGAAAGVYSMIRFGGSLLGAALGGVMLQTALDAQLATVAAYRLVFLAIAAMALTGVLLGARLRE
jgi:MFS family permease